MYKAFFIGRDILTVSIFNVIAVNRIINQIIKEIS